MQSGRPKSDLNRILRMSSGLVKLLGFATACALTGLVLYAILRVVRRGSVSAPDEMVRFVGFCVLFYFLLLILVEVLGEALPRWYELAVLSMLVHVTHSPVLLYNILLRPAWAAHILENLPVESAVDALVNITTDRAANFLHAVDPDLRRALLKLLPDVRKWIIYERYYGMTLEKRGGMTLVQFERLAESNEITF